MKDLGQKEKDMYDSPASPESQKNKVTYPEISFPLALIEGMELDIDDIVDIHVKGRVSGLENTRWSKRVSFEAKEGEVKKVSNKKENILSEA